MTWMKLKSKKKKLSTNHFLLSLFPISVWNETTVVINSSYSTDNLHGCNLCVSCNNDVETIIWNFFIFYFLYYLLCFFLRKRWVPWVDTGWMNILKLFSNFSLSDSRPITISYKFNNLCSTKLISSVRNKCEFHLYISSMIIIELWEYSVFSNFFSSSFKKTNIFDYPWSIPCLIKMWLSSWIQLDTGGILQCNSNFLNLDSSQTALSVFLSRFLFLFSGKALLMTYYLPLSVMDMFESLRDLKEDLEHYLYSNG